MFMKMMSKNDFMEKQILLINSNKNDKIRFSNSNIILERNNKIVLKHSCYKIFCIFVIGEFTITSILLKNAKKFSFPIVFLNYNLKPFFVFSEDNRGNFLLRKKQYSISEKKSLLLSKWIVKNKVSNQILLLKELRYKSKDLKLVIKQLEIFLGKVNYCKSFNELLGLEGNVAKLYFKIYFKNLNFKGRKPRIKSDIINLLLDIGYFYLFGFIEANLLLYGFDIYYGFYHKLFYQRKSLVCDIIEPFRIIIDKKIRKMYNLKQVDNKDFYCKNGIYFLKKDKSKKYSELFLKEILKYKKEIFLFIRDFYRALIKNKDIQRYPLFEVKK